METIYEVILNLAGNAEFEILHVTLTNCTAGRAIQLRVDVPNHRQLLRYVAQWKWKERKDNQPSY